MAGSWQQPEDPGLAAETSQLVHPGAPAVAVNLLFHCCAGEECMREARAVWEEGGGGMH